MAWKKGFLSITRDWNGWPAAVRIDGDKIQIQRSHGIPLEVQHSHLVPVQAKTYSDVEMIAFITEKAQGLEGVEVTLSSTGRGYDKFLVVSGWTADLTDAETSDAKKLRL